MATLQFQYIQVLSDAVTMLYIVIARDAYEAHTEVMRVTESGRFFDPGKTRMPRIVRVDREPSDGEAHTIYVAGDVDLRDIRQGPGPRRH